MGDTLDEAIGVGGVSGRQGVRPPFAHRLCLAVVDAGRGHEAEARVPVLVVVPVEEPLAERSGVLDRAELLGLAPRPDPGRTRRIPPHRIWSSVTSALLDQLATTGG